MDATDAPRAPDRRLTLMLHPTDPVEIDTYPRAIKPPAELDDGTPVDLPPGFAPYLVARGDFALTARLVVAAAAAPLVRSAVRVARGVEEYRERYARPELQYSPQIAQLYRLRVHDRSIPTQWLIAVCHWRAKLRRRLRIAAYLKDKPVVKRITALLRCEPPGMEPARRADGRRGRHCGLTSCCLFCHARAAGEATVALARAANRRPTPSHPVRFLARRVPLTARALSHKDLLRLAGRFGVDPRLVGAAVAPEPAVAGYELGLRLARRAWGAVPTAERAKLETPVRHLFAGRRGRPIRSREQFLRKALDPRTALDGYGAAGGVLCRKPLSRRGTGVLLLVTDRRVKRSEQVPHDGAGFWLAPRVAAALAFPAKWLKESVMLRRVERSLKRQGVKRRRVREYATFGLCRQSGTASGPRSLGYRPPDDPRLGPREPVPVGDGSATPTPEQVSPHRPDAAMPVGGTASSPGAAGLNAAEGTSRMGLAPAGSVRARPPVPGESVAPDAPVSRPVGPRRYRRARVLPRAPELALTVPRAPPQGAPGRCVDP